MSIALLVALNVPVYVLLGWLFFGDLAGLWRSLRYVLTPDLFSAFRGEFFEDRWESLKFGAWILCCVVVVLAEVQGFSRLGWMAG